ncbi:hypothetical protein E2C01_079998 [Portunus trituberculatus]|uniref:Uncharacterized protein n=1 Tax=Portunus trituberculatus TaxID=210409 RepID=A0A5B7IYD4_PORTR|nr:hypothetical protein [Portunus trituberculatus]
MGKRLTESQGPPGDPREASTSSLPISLLALPFPPGSLGGYTGVFLGCSFVTFMELLVYIGLVVAVWVKDLRNWLCGEVHPTAKERAGSAD